MTKPWEITKEQHKEAKAWWRELSINEMKAFVKKFFPAFETNYILLSQMPSFVFNIYEQEMAGVK